MASASAKLDSLIQTLENHKIPTNFREENKVKKYPDSKYLDDLTKLLYTSDQIQSKCREMGAQISKDYEGKKLVVVGLLRGAFMFQADLVRCITIPHEVDFMMLGSYSGTQSHMSRLHRI
eukprot:390030_1